MAQPVTEIVILPVVPGSSFEDTSSGTGQMWNRVLTTLSAQHGMERIAWGHQVEEKDTLEAMINWTTLADHEQFMKSPEYGPLLSESLTPLASSPPTVFHVQFETPVTGPSSAPVTEMATFYFPMSYSNSQFDGPFQVFKDAVISSNYALAISGGWVVEELPHESLGDAKGKAFVIAIGWESVEKHMQFRETAEFKTTLPPLRDQCTGISMHHVQFRQY